MYATRTGEESFARQKERALPTKTPETLALGNSQGTEIITRVSIGTADGVLENQVIDQPVPPLNVSVPLRLPPMQVQPYPPLSSGDGFWLPSLSFLLHAFDHQIDQQPDCPFLPSQYHTTFWVLTRRFSNRI